MPNLRKKVAFNRDLLHTVCRIGQGCKQAKLSPQNTVRHNSCPPTNNKDKETYNVMFCIIKQLEIIKNKETNKGKQLDPEVKRLKPEMGKMGDQI